MSLVDYYCLIVIGRKYDETPPRHDVALELHGLHKGGQHPAWPLKS
jgi:hypothetical protein